MTAREGGVPRRLVTHAEDLLEQLTDEGELALGLLSSDELAAVTPAEWDGNRLVALPVVDGLDAAARRQSRVTALRALVARELVDPAVLDEPPDDAVGLGALDDTFGVIAWARRAPDFVCWTDRRWDGRLAQRYSYALGSLAALDEDVWPARGLHGFSLRTRPRAAVALADFVDPRGWARDAAEAVTRFGDSTPPGWEAVERAVAQARAVSHVRAVRPAGLGGQRCSLSVAAGRDGVWVLAGSAPPPQAVLQGARARVTGQRVDRDALTLYLAAALEFDRLPEAAPAAG